MNYHSLDDRQRLMLTCCYQAVRLHFSHIAIRDIIDPPREMLDAALARQCALALMRDAFNVPARRVAIIVDRNRGRIKFANWTVNTRRECPVFERAYLSMARRARDIFLRAVRSRMGIELEEDAA
ncbi:hypothetical protein P7F60_28790 [Rhizobium sp. YJ-22]|uniref:hypothetical protein n=1 Tax=Rhizobium sp. YJ-22 TaxID=3037556 RepID=UPI002412C66D|nr:hypothetical protein [Rhizobium sp. YJ-22]MDG3580380.1 hypothetical protein [Rhizobium sp. YJ-22]